MKRLARTLVFIVLHAVTALPNALYAAESTSRILDSVIFNQHLLCLFADGSIAAWTLPAGKLNVEFTNKLQQSKLQQLAGDSSGVWAINNHQLLRWAEATSTWSSVTNIGDEQPEKLVIVDKVPVLIYARVVRAPTLHRSYPVPQLGGQLRVDHLRVLATHVQGGLLWIGTGQGEWGGHLVGLNIRTGNWVKHHDPLHYATGVTSSKNGALYVSWSMSHLLADTLIRNHSSNAAPSNSFPVLQDSYYQDIVYSEFDQKLYGIEQNHLVSIDAGKPTVLADLGKLEYDPEPHAVGIGPAISGFFAIAPQTLVVVHRSVLPYLYTQGDLQQLER